MQKIRTTVKIAGKDYTISSFDGEAHVQRIAAYLDRKMNDLSAATRLPAAQLSMMAAISITDDLLKARDDVTRLQRELDMLHEEIDELRKAREE